MPTSLMQRIGISTPIIQAPMAGGGDTAELVAAVSNAGGLGMIGAAYLMPEQIIERGRAVRALTSQPFGINLFAPIPVPPVDDVAIEAAMNRIKPFFDELYLPAPERPQPPQTNFNHQFAACMEIGAAVISVAFGLMPGAAVAECKRRNILVAGTATTVREAQQLADAGVDAVIAQGGEAGGHRSTFAGSFEAGMVGTMALVPQVVDAVRVPVIASGGIMDGRGIAAALALGASAVQLGTAFLTCNEAGVSTAYKQAIVSAREDDTAITRAFSGRPARGIRNRMLNDYEHDSAILPFPHQNALTRPLRNAASKAGRAEFLSLWAGQGLTLARQQTAAELVARLQTETTQAIASLNQLR
jgi:nitronate monooxygenase